METSNTFVLRLPLSLKKAAEDFAREDGSTLNRFIVTAVAEKLAALKTADYVTNRASRADVTAFDRLMSRDDGVGPRPEDRWDGMDTANLANADGASGPGRD